MASRFNSKGFFDRPTKTINSRLDSLSINLNFFSPLTNRKSYSIKSYISSLTGVKNLFRISRPFNILRFIITFVVNSINAMLRGWSISNILKKISKLKPSFTNSNSSASIMGISFNTWILTSSNHMPPRTPFLSLAFIHSMTMFIIRVFIPCKQTFTRAATALRYTASNRNESYGAFSSTVAFTKGKLASKLIFIFRKLFKDCPRHMAILYTNNVYFGRRVLQ